MVAVVVVVVVLLLLLLSALLLATLRWSFVCWCGAGPSNATVVVGVNLILPPVCPPTPTSPPSRRCDVVMCVNSLCCPPSNVSWFYPKYWPMLTRWADELVRTSEYPAEQLCTDDFTGRLANNTNLGVSK